MDTTPYEQTPILAPHQKVIRAVGVIVFAQEFLYSFIQTLGHPLIEATTKTPDTFETVSFNIGPEICERLQVDGHVFGMVNAAAFQQH